MKFSSIIITIAAGVAVSLPACGASFDSAMLSGMAYESPSPEPLVIPPPGEIREMIRTRMEEVRALRRLLKLSEAAAQVQAFVGGDDTHQEAD